MLEVLRMDSEKEVGVVGRWFCRFGEGFWFFRVLFWFFFLV